MSFLAFEQIAEMWFDQEMSEDRMTPRYLVSVTLFKTFPLMLAVHDLSNKESHMHRNYGLAQN